MSSTTFTSLKARAAGQTTITTEAVDEYLADLEELTAAGIGMVLIDPFLPFLHDVQEEIVAGVLAHYDDDQVLVISHQEYADLCQANGFQAAISEVGSVPFLILSDLWIGHSDSQSRFFNMHLKPLMEHRWRNNLPTIITTRSTAQELARAYPAFWNLVEHRNVIEELR